MRASSVRNGASVRASASVTRDELGDQHDREHHARRAEVGDEERVEPRIAGWVVSRRIGRRARPRRRY